MFLAYVSPIKLFAFDLSGAIYDKNNLKCIMQVDEERLIGVIMRNVPDPMFGWHVRWEYLIPGIIDEDHPLLQGSVMDRPDFPCFKASTNGAWILTRVYPIPYAYGYGQVYRF